MTQVFGTSIFWTTLAVTTATLMAATIIGRTWALLLPKSLLGPTRFYLAPALGLASLTIIASWLGQYLPLGDSIVVPAATVVLVVFCLATESAIRQAVKHGLVIAAFGVVCGLSVLAPLFLSGSFNAHNDAFTYLVQSDWLQGHAFRDAIAPGDVTPYSSQIFLYQAGKLRMGASFLLAFLQGALNLRQSDNVYPGLVIAALSSCCLALGFPAARSLRRLLRGTRLAVLVLPALGVGGLIFGANYGFLPQTVGLAICAATIFLAGSVLSWCAAQPRDARAVVKAALPSAVLFSAAVFAYTEITPFIFLAVVLSALLQGVRHRRFKSTLTFVAAAGVMSVIALNTELYAAFVSLRAQAGVVVGSPVAWSLAGFAAHAFGVHGGAWDVFQWSMPGAPFKTELAGLLALASILGVLALSTRRICKATTGVLLPTLILLAVFTAGLIYFRYGVPSPFAIGTGQSWSEFKLAEWAFPFTTGLVVFALADLKRRIGEHFGKLLAVLLAVGAVSSIVGSNARTNAVMSSYPTVANLHRFYRELRPTVDRVCQPGQAIYLNLGGAEQKVREMAVLYLHGRRLKSDWSDDVYFSKVPADVNSKAPAAGDCIIERADAQDWVAGGTVIGPLAIARSAAPGHFKIASASAPYARESEGANWWYWVKRDITFSLAGQAVPASANATRVHFQYMSRTPQTFTLNVIGRGGATETIVLRDADIGALGTFDRSIPIAPQNVTALSIVGDGAATPLGKGDTRVAGWMIRNLSVLPEVSEPVARTIPTPGPSSPPATRP
jgi:hypothetical protein